MPFAPPCSRCAPPEVHFALRIITLGQPTGRFFVFHDHQKIETGGFARGHPVERINERPFPMRDELDFRLRPLVVRMVRHEGAFQEESWRRSSGSNIMLANSVPFARSPAPRHYGFPRLCSPLGRFTALRVPPVPAMAWAKRSPAVLCFAESVLRQYVCRPNANPRLAFRAA